MSRTAAQQTAFAAKGTVAKVGISLHEVLADLVTLDNPTRSAAVVAFILVLIPGVGIPTTTLVAIVAAVGVVASLVEKFTGV
jgi:predicted membrane protein